MTALPVERAALLGAGPDKEQGWLIDQLWGEQAVGLIGGEPKCCKSFLALDMAVAVASGAPCLGRFAVRTPGRVLLYAAEDALHVVRRRLLGICGARGVDFSTLDVQVITAPVLRLDLDADQRRLKETIAALAPKLLILDPFVRLHRIDENISGEVAPLLAYLRDLQRTYALGVAVVHHAKKGAGGVRAGQALRGSSEFHAWGDSNLYMRRQGDEQLTLSVEQRAAASFGPAHVALGGDDDSLALAVVERPTAVPALEATSPAARITHALETAAAPLPLAALRATCGIRKATLLSCLASLCDDGRVTKTAAGYALSAAL
jgi:hypothetical protein